MPKRWKPVAAGHCNTEGSTMYCPNCQMDVDYYEEDGADYTDFICLECGYVIENVHWPDDWDEDW